ncbi:MAG: mechanosensitive ion channel [Lachnospiraceae bacterium]|uniref:mechanosensitive ion channel domain-containing protein n=1 Tax=Roseburia hominis TaxID=301301 RepID=UPI001F40B134|nr:mechanosensitive ion channel [Roseburia hominis]MCI5713003.1 mechanosensitive ion channel [Lachnospiraceae bacterium]MDD6170799.1 mechanosensitive ion channel [Lachnospiraceae bacterium]MDY4838545.1 mechanosensitive ion channel [Lachnospiraceae bacterium]
MVLLEMDTEQRLSDIVQKEAEAAQNADLSKIRSFLQGLLPEVVSLGIQILLAILIWFIGVKLVKFLRKRIRKWLAKLNFDTGVIQFLDSLIKIVAYFILICIILGLFGIQTTSIVAVLTSASLAAGLALQGSLANFAGGVLILALKPFVVGDYIIEDTHGNEGTVMHISTVYTKLKTVDNKTIVIPNGTLANSSLTNLTQMEKRIVDLKIGVAYHTDLKKAKEVITEVIMAEEARILDEPVKVFVSELGASEITIGCRIWVKTEDYWEARWRLLENLKNALDEHQIEIPFQQIDVNLKQ